MTEAERIKHLRKDVLGLTLGEFGKRMDVSAGTLSPIETGKNPVSAKMRRTICSTFSVNEEWLISGEGDIFETADRRQKIQTWAERALQDSTDSFKFKFIAMLTELPDEWWDILEKKAMEIFREEDPAGAKAIENEVEDYRHQLEEEKRQADESSPSHASGE